MKRRRKGTGTIERLGGGLFRARMPDSARTRLSSWPTESEAVTELVAAIAEKRDGLYLASGETLRAFGACVLDDRELAGIRGIGTERSRWKQHIEGQAFAGLPLKAISAPMIREWLAGLLKKRAAPGHGHKKARPRRLARQTAQNVLNLLRILLKAAVESGRAATNPADGVHLPRSQGVTHEPWTYLVPDEQALLFEAEAEPDELRDLAAFALATGLRQGEQWNLPLTDVHVDHVVVRYGSKGRATKSGKVRRVPLFGLAVGAVERQRERLKGRSNPHGLLWPTERGARRPKGKAPRGWRALLLAVGIVASKRHDGRAVRWHDLRHSCASSLVAGWWGRRWSLEEVRQLLGHSSVTVTERYAHLADSALAQAARDTSTLRPVSQPNGTLTIGNRLAPPARIGLATFGLGKQSDIDANREVTSLRGLIVDLSEHARRGLAAIASGEPGAWRLVTEALEQVVDAGLALNAEAPHVNHKKVSRRS